MRAMRFSRNSVDDQLATMHLEGEKRDAERRAKKENLPSFEFKSLPDREALNIIPEAVARGAGLAVFEKDENKLSIAVFSSRDKRAQETIEALTEGGITPKLFITTLSTLENLWAGYAGDKKEKKRKEITSKVELNKDKIDEVRNEIESIKDAIAFFEKIDKNTETSNLLGYILGAALALRSSDIHIEYTAKDKAHLRFRIDGRLRDITNIEERPTNLLM